MEIWEKVRIIRACSKGSADWKKDLYLNKMFSPRRREMGGRCETKKTEGGRRRRAAGATVTGKPLTWPPGAPRGVILRGEGEEEELRGGPAGGKTLRSNYMDGWRAEAGINDTAARGAGAGLAPGLSVTAADNASRGS